MPKLRSTYDGRLIYQTSYEGRKAFLRYSLIAKLLRSSEIVFDKKLSYRRGTARCVVSIEILPIVTQQCRNYLYDKS